MSVTTAPEWHEQGACRDFDFKAAGIDPWHPEGTGRPARDGVRLALTICAECPVRQLCLDEALADDQQYGIRGGMTAPARARLKSGAQQPPARPARDITAPTAPCGTRSAYARHIRKREPIDDACRMAQAAYHKARRAQRREAAS